VAGSGIRRTVSFAAASAAAALLLAGCGSASPGDAAVVGPDTIPVSQVDDVATALCSANASGSQQQLATRQARQGALSVLIQTALADQLGAKQRVQADPAQVSAALDQNAATIQALPPDERPAFRSALQDYVEGQLMVREAGRKALQANGAATVTDQRAQAAGAALLQRYAKTVDISVDPRFGTFEQGDLKAGSGSLSVPVSARAADGSSSNPSASWVSGLPVNQKCS
jgi:hypothetical protein